MHSVGFHHEHSRPDRDKYITINWKNIDKDKKNNFLKKKLDQVNLIGEYDICSVVHYGINVFVKEDLLKVRSIFHSIHCICSCVILFITPGRWNIFMGS